jgi:hypothetical protein
MDTITLTYDGRTVALAAPARFWLAAHIQALPDGHPRKRHDCFMALYARDILTRDMPGPYTDTDADHFAHLAISSCRTLSQHCARSRRHRGRRR